MSMKRKFRTIDQETSTPENNFFFSFSFFLFPVLLFNPIENLLSFI